MRGLSFFFSGILVAVAVQMAIAQDNNRGIVRLNHVGITVPDMDAAVEYYTETLGFPEAFRALDEAGEARLVYLQVSKNTFVELNRANGRPTGINHLGINVENMEAVTAMFKRQGAEVAEIRDSSTGAILSNITDLNGIRIELAELPPESDHWKAMDRWR